MFQGFDISVVFYESMYKFIKPKVSNQTTFPKSHINK